MAKKSTPAAQATKHELLITRVFDAPRDLVFRAWTEPEHMLQWSAPQSHVMTHSEGEARRGGAWRACMRSADGEELWLGGVYREVVANELLVFTHAWDREDGNPGHETLVTVRFEDDGRKTRMTFLQTGFDSRENRDGHREGWSECFDLLAGYLSRIAPQGR